MEFNREEAYKIYLKNESLTEATKQWCAEKGLEYETRYMHRLKRYVGANANTTASTSETTDYPGGKKDKDTNEDIEVFMPSAWDAELNRFLSIDEYCEKYGLPIDQVRSSKLIAHQNSHMIYNIVFTANTLDPETGIDSEFIEEVVNKYISTTKVTEAIPEYMDSVFFDRLVYTDAHINMSPGGGKNTDPLYEHVWDKETVLARLDKMIKHTITFQRGNTLYIDELGDLMDGLEGKTTRKGHDLPQLYSDKEAFDIGVKFKIELVERLLPYYDKIICNNITNDNHSFLFGFFVNKTAKLVLEQKYPNKVVYNIQEKFMEHYTVGSHTFVISHGKDSGEKKFGMKPFMDAKVSETIDHYCKQHKLYSGNFIEFSKGDSHQRVFDTTTSDDFAYHNYGSFSPPSNWVTTNFKNTKSSFDLFNIHRRENIKINIPFIF